MKAYHFNWLQKGLLILFVAAVYYIAGRIGQLMALPPGYVTPVWPSSGIALTAAFLLGNQGLAGIFLGSFLNNFLLFPDILQNYLKAVFISSGIGFGATLQAYVGAFLLQKFTNSKPFETAGNAFKFIVISIISCLINSIIGTFSLSMGQSVKWLETWWTWWIGDSAGILIFTPFILSWILYPLRKPYRIGEALLILALVFIILVIIFQIPYSLTYLLIPIVVWAGFRFYLKGVTTVIFLIFSLTIWQTIQEKGPFFSEASLNISLILLVLFFAVLVSMALLLVGVLQERRRTRQLLEEYNVDLEKKVKERTIELELRLEQLKKMRELVINKEKLASLGTLAAGVAHEIKNPLNFIANFSELSLDLIDQMQSILLTQKEKISSESSTELNEIIKLLHVNISKANEQAKRAIYTIQGMLTHAREQTEFEETDLNEIIHEYVKLAYYSKKQKSPDLNIQIKSELDSTLKPFSFNKHDIIRVILNLLDNAFDSIEEKKHLLGEGYEPMIHITTKDKVHQVEITLKDNGIGIPESIQDKIFVPFFTQKKLSEGTGLGLSICFDIIVKEHGGVIEFESKEGEFTKFIILLPKVLRHPLND